MQKHFLDQGVFIRSMATRGSFGGLTRSTADAVVVLEAMGKDVVIIETVGVGQDEVDIANSAHTTVLVTIPGMGDEIQAIKAGLMEIGDLFVVNKADRQGTAKTLREIRFMLELSSERYQEWGWMPPVLATTALDEGGVDELYQSIQDHGRYLTENSGERLKERQQARVERQLVDLIKDNLIARALEKIGGQNALSGMVVEILSGKRDPYGVCFELVDQLLEGGPR
jgi:LAO/AO transport system kinase